MRFARQDLRAARRRALERAWLNPPSSAREARSKCAASAAQAAGSPSAMACDTGVCLDDFRRASVSRR